jgi:hypothetical protein
MVLDDLSWFMWNGAAVLPFPPNMAQAEQFLTTWREEATREIQAYLDVTAWIAAQRAQGLRDAYYSKIAAIEQRPPTT